MLFRSLILRDYENGCINIVVIIQEFIFPANGAGKLPPDTAAGQSDHDHSTVH